MLPPLSRKPRLLPLSRRPALTHTSPAPFGRRILPSLIAPLPPRRTVVPAAPSVEKVFDRLAKMDVIIMATLVLGFFLATLFFTTRSHKKGNSRNLQPVSTGKALRTYTKAEVSLHNSRKDCWIIVKDKVYNVTPYVEEHPGGDAILKNAGGDSTEGFHGPQHATRVFDMVDEFYIGDLKPC